MELNGLIHSFDYIESARSYAYNKGKKRLIKKEKLADLYFAGSYILKLIKEHGTKENKEGLKRLEKNMRKNLNNKGVYFVKRIQKRT